jgi:hypothetical protein
MYKYCTLYSSRVEGDKATERIGQTQIKRKKEVSGHNTVEIKKNACTVGGFNFILFLEFQ